MGLLNNKFARYFAISAGVILAVTGFAKLISSEGAAQILQVSDPIFGITFQHLFWLVGSLEVIIAIACLVGRKGASQALYVASLSTGFLAYRVGLWWIGWQRPCSCLGNLTDLLHIAPETGDLVMKICLVYLVMGSYLILAIKWARSGDAGTGI
jgi:hypothetical protein